MMRQHPPLRHRPLPPLLIPLWMVSLILFFVSWTTASSYHPKPSMVAHPVGRVQPPPPPRQDCRIGHEDITWIHQLPRGGSGSSDGSGEDNHNQSKDIPVLPSTQSPVPTTTDDATVVDTVQAVNTVSPSNEPSTITTTTTNTAAVAAVATTTTSTNTTNTNNTTLVDAVRAVLHNMVTTLVAITLVVQKHISHTPQQLGQTVRTTFENLQPYVPQNTQYTLSPQQPHHSIIIRVTAALLAMNSGYLNGLGLYGLATAITTAQSNLATTTTTTTAASASTAVPTVQAVAAVTGAYTQLGLQMARGNLVRAATVPMRLIFSYLLGSFMTGFIVHHAPMVPYEMSTYPVSILFAIGTVALFAVSSTLSSNTLSMKVFYLLTFVNGLQNSLTSIYSNNQIRSSHYTGMTSDIGTFLGQYIRSCTSSDSDDITQKRNTELQNTLLPKIYRNTLLSTSFIVGGMLSYWISSQPTSIRNANFVMLPSLLLYLTFTIVSLLWKPSVAPTTTTSTTA
jgi:uncharacterized membrane protein YoaK (UPF0700 family)